MPKVPVGPEAGLFRKLTEDMFRVPEDSGKALETDTLPQAGVNAVHDSGTGVSTRLSAIYGDRLKIIGNGPAVEYHLRKLELIPDSFHKKLAEYYAGHPEGGIYLVDGPVTDVLTELRGVRPRGWTAGKTWEDVSGGHQPATHRVVVGGRPSIRDDSALHESGHGVDYALGGLRDSPEFTALYDKVGKMVPYLMQPGDVGRKETFAESFYSWISHRDLPAGQRATAIAEELGISVDKKFRGGLFDKYFTDLQHRLEAHP